MDWKNSTGFDTQVIDEGLAEWCDTLPENLREPAKYVLLSGGHRIRPLLTVAWAMQAGGSQEDALPAALAVELIHTMSLIYDDLPCMDNAEERRGGAAVHKKYGERTAVLLGGVLLSGAYGLLMKMPPEKAAAAALELDAAVARMAAGQEDEAGGAPWWQVHTGKTAALLEAACVLGVIAGEGRADVEKAREFGREFGLAYQLIDDAHDSDGAAAELGAQRALELGHERLQQLRTINPTVGGLVLLGMKGLEGMERGG